MALWRQSSRGRPRSSNHLFASAARVRAEPLSLAWKPSRRSPKISHTSTFASSCSGRPFAGLGLSFCNTFTRAPAVARPVQQTATPTPRAPEAPSRSGAGQGRKRRAEAVSIEGSPAPCRRGSGRGGRPHPKRCRLSHAPFAHESTRTADRAIRKCRLLRERRQAGRRPVCRVVRALGGRLASVCSQPPPTIRAPTCISRRCLRRSRGLAGEGGSPLGQTAAKRRVLCAFAPLPCAAPDPAW
jgi:hypothetical protein